jgi:hypothetical protein
VLKATDGTQGYDDTNNPGGEYQLEVCADAAFTPSRCKYDNFKVRSLDGGGGGSPTAQLNVVKYYDLNANGQRDLGETLITGWRFEGDGGIGVNFTSWTGFFTPPSGGTTYTITEHRALGTACINTDPAGAGPLVKSTLLVPGDNDTVAFGNVCVGAGGGLTLGFWSNKNGEAILKAGDDNFAAALARLSGLNLVNAGGAAFDPASYADYRSWLLSASATNMAYMLSAQLSAMSNNVTYGRVAGSALIYAPGAAGANDAGFATVAAVMTEANASLAANPLTVDGGTTRSYQEALKNALDRANNNLNFVQNAPCPFSFAALN